MVLRMGHAGRPNSSPMEHLPANNSPEMRLALRQRYWRAQLFLLGFQVPCPGYGADAIESLDWRIYTDSPLTSASSAFPWACGAPCPGAGRRAIGSTLLGSERQQPLHYESQRVASSCVPAAHARVPSMPETASRSSSTKCSFSSPETDRKWYVSAKTAHHCLYFPLS